MDIIGMGRRSKGDDSEMVRHRTATTLKISDDRQRFRLCTLCAAGVSNHICVKLCMRQKRDMII